jgi:prolyl 4-hydroxylase
MDDANGNDLERRAAAGDAQAQLALARKFESDGRHEAARAWYARAATGGNLVALRSLAVNLLTCPPLAVGDGIGMIRAAADGGDGEACHICSILAGQDSDLAGHWEVALDYLRRAADLKLPLARAELELLAGTFEPLDNATLRARCDIARWLASPPLHMAFESPRIAVIENFASPEFCDWLIGRARPRLTHAEVFNPETGGGKIAKYRTNTTAPFALTEQDLIFGTLRARIAAITAIALSALEPPAVLHYDPGETYDFHHDFLEPAIPQFARDIAERGQRVATFLVYLNDGYDGGETQFSELDWSYKGRKGDALLFWNTDSDGAPDRRTRHAGLPLRSGEKWVLSQWIREEKLPRSVNRG